MQGTQGTQGTQGANSTIIGENAQTGTSYTLSLTDAYKMITLSNASAISLLVPTNASVPFANYTEVYLEWEGVGQPTISAVTPGTTTILSTAGTPAAPALRARYSTATLWKRGTDDWRVTGDIV